MNPCEQFLARGNSSQDARGIAGLSLNPILDLGIFQVLHIAIRVDDLVAEIFVRDGRERCGGSRRRSVSEGDSDRERKETPQQGARGARIHDLPPGRVLQRRVLQQIMAQPTSASPLPWT